MKKNVQIIIPIYHPRTLFRDLLEQLKKQTVGDVSLLIIDSGEDTWYESLLQEEVAHLIRIPAENFNHGGTRQMGMEVCQEADIFIFFTQDAVPFNEYSIENLVSVFDDERVGCAYGRQIPHKGAGVFGSIARNFNYPTKSHVYTFEDRVKYGIKTAFISNSFAAYRKDAMRQVGGFPQHTILSEDMCVAAKMLIKGWQVAYVSNAMVYHSHDYTILQEFRRYFDIGVFHARESWIQEEFGKAEGEGKKFIMEELRYIFRHCPYRLVEMILRDGMKFLGYRLGMKEASLKNSWKKRLSMFPRYWNEPPHEIGRRAY